jgi:hypothetical protein
MNRNRSAGLPNFRKKLYAGLSVAEPWGQGAVAILADQFLTASKSQKQNTKFSHTPKNQQNFVHFFALASKSG